MVQNLPGSNALAYCARKSLANKKSFKWLIKGLNLLNLLFNAFAVKKTFHFDFPWSGQNNRHQAND
jgi:hypothetical protein